MLKSRITKLTLCYLKFIIPYFEKINTKFPTEEPLVHKQCRLMEQCIKEFMTMFVKSAAIVSKPLGDMGSEAHTTSIMTTMCLWVKR